MHPWGVGEDMELWIDRKYVPAGYGWSFPAGDEIRIGVGSFDPRFHVKDTTVMLAEDLERDPVRYQGNWIPHRLRAATADGMFFVGDRAGHCLPLTAEGIRTAFYFAIACGRELRAVVDGPAVDRAPRWPATATSRRRTAGSSRRCWPPRSWSRAYRRACSTARSGQCRRSASSTGASARTWRSPRRCSPQPARPRAAPAAPRRRSPLNPFDPYFSCARSKKASRFRQEAGPRVDHRFGSDLLIQVGAIAPAWPQAELQSVAVQ